MNSPAYSLNKLHVALIAGATAIFAAVPAAQAAIVFVDRSSSPIPITNSIDGVYLNVVTGVTGASGLDVPGWDIDPYNNTSGLTFYGSASPGGVLATGVPGTGAVATALAFGALISSAGQYNQFQTQGTAFQSTGTRYLGFRFLNETTSAINYGWLQVTSGALPSPDGGFPAAITAYGYENAGASISAGAAPVPEPGTWALFGLGLAGLGLRSLKRRPG